MTESSPSSPPEIPWNWDRLQRSLSYEADKGFNDVMGQQYRFSEFLSLSLQQPPAEVVSSDRDRWQELATQYAQYPTMSFAQRQHLVADTRRLIYQTRKATETPAPASAGIASDSSVSAPARTTRKVTPKTTPLETVTPVPQTGRVPTLDQPVTYLPGIGPKNSDRLALLGIITVKDLLFYFPRDYLDYANQVRIADLQEGETVTIVGTVQSCSCFTSSRNKKLTIFEITMSDPTGRIRLSRFYMGTRYANYKWQAMQKRQYPKGAAIAASGLVKASRGKPTLDSPQIEVLDHTRSAIESTTVGRVVPIYPLTGEVKADLIRRAIVQALPAAVNLVDPLPKPWRDRYELAGLETAIAHIHYPPNSEALSIARRRLIFDEFFYLQLGLLRRRATQQAESTDVILAPTGPLIDQFTEILPFGLTGAQQRVVNEILTDLQKPVPMNRLVQGDVGSGKTVVGVLAALSAIQSGYQVALMAPTEVLAEQHYRKLVGWFALLHLPVELLTGSTKTAKRRQIHAELATGELPILVGTHALIEDPVQFQRLGLVIIDEQHRFGVQQRARLQRKGNNPHVLTLTATPIPRTLALTLHGDLDVSQIDELPPGRKPIKTTLLNASQRNHAYDLIKRELAQGYQTYVVLPLVDESEKLDLRSAIEEHQRLQEVIFPDFTVGLLHGRMSSAEKDAAISAFREGHTQILVSTTVVEVGVDVPNATVMLIEHAERFGLAQLHQLRGRVGRGAAQAHCILMSSSKAENARDRLSVLTQSQDGFFIAEMDLRFRGPGQVLGTRQSGLPDFALASLIEDQSILELARTAAEELIKGDRDLTQYPNLKTELELRYKKLMGGAIFT